MVAQLVFAVNVGVAGGAAILLPIFGSVEPIQAASLFLKVVLAAGYIALAWATSRNNLKLKSALFVHLAVVYLAMAICAGAPYYEALWASPRFDMT